VDLSGANRTFNVANGSSDVDLAINVPITNGGLTKTGAGTLALNGANTYTGDRSFKPASFRPRQTRRCPNWQRLPHHRRDARSHFSGASDYVHGLYFNGVPQAYGVIGAVECECAGAGFCQAAVRDWNVDREIDIGRSRLATLKVRLAPP